MTPHKDDDVPTVEIFLPGMELPDNLQKCATVALDAVEARLKKYEEDWDDAINQSRGEGVVVGFLLGMGALAVIWTAVHLIVANGMN